MSGTCRSPLMWAHYVDNYQGACLCFSSDKTFSSLKRVEYCTERKVYDMISGSSNVTELVRKSFGQKNSEWSYEHEWRMIERNDDKLPQKYIRFEQGELKGLILGHRMPSEIHDYLKNVLPGEVKLLKTYIGHRTYKIQLLGLTFL